MIDLIEQNSAIYLALMWLAITTFLAVLSGWFRLMRKFPDRDEPPLLQLKYSSGAMGLGVSLRSILTLSICPSGLRIGMLRLFGPFCRDFLVPWENIAVTRETSLFSPVVKLHFGDPVIGTLRISPDAAERLAFTASGRWPKTEPRPEEGRRNILRRLLTQWAVFTGAAALFFVFAPLLLGSGGGRPPFLVGILFPAIFFGVVTFMRFLAERR